MATINGFKNWIQSKDIKSHQEMSAELRMMLRKNGEQPLQCSYEMKHKDNDGCDVLLKFWQIDYVENEGIVFDTETIYDGECLPSYYDIDELSIDLIKKIIMTIKEPSLA